MKLHENEELMDDLCAIVSSKIGITSLAVKRDYFIVLALDNLVKSSYSELCVFKGGTSLSKAYSGSINRFSEDIDLTYLPYDNMKNKEIDKELKKD